MEPGTPHKMLLEADPYQTRIAILEDDRLTEVLIERRDRLGSVGNIYRGRVSRVLPGMQAAFVDIGIERDAFLYVRDVADLLDDADLERDGEDSDGEEGATPEGESFPSISDLLRQGQELTVQVLKDPLPNKGARITTHVSLPGRYLVLMPTTPHLGVSRRIEDEQERERLRGLLSDLAPAGMGLIVRTEGEGKGVEEFEADRDYLLSLWKEIESRGEDSRAPTLLHRDLDLALRVARDLFGRTFSMLWIDGEESYTRVVEFLAEVQPTLLDRVRLYRQEGSLFERFGIDEEIEAALRSKVWLKSGGYIVINPTEALVAIDVNTGRFVGGETLEDTVVKTNLEAVREIVRQIRLRDLGGIIVIDLIDMINPEHREEVFAALERELKKDRARNKVLSISDFGLVELTRKRSRTNLERLLTQRCPYCHGRGRIRSVETICLNLRRELLRSRSHLTSDEVLVRVNPEVAQALGGADRAILEEMERTLGVSILVKSDPDLHQERFDILEV